MYIFLSTTKHRSPSDNVSSPSRFPLTIADQLSHAIKFFYRYHPMYFSLIEIEYICYKIYNYFNRNRIYNYFQFKTVQFERKSGNLSDKPSELLDYSMIETIQNVIFLIYVNPRDCFLSYYKITRRNHCLKFTRFV